MYFKGMSSCFLCLVGILLLLAGCSEESSGPERKAERADEDSDTALILQQLQRAKESAKEDSARHYYQKAKKKARALGSKKWKGVVALKGGQLAQGKGHLKKALERAQKAQRSLEGANTPRYLNQLYDLKGQLFAYLGKSDSSLIYFQKQKALAEEKGYKKEVGRVCNNLSYFYYRQGENKKALEKARQALDIFKELEDSTRIASAYNFQGNAYLRMSSLPDALDAYLNALSIHKALGNEEELGKLHLNVGNIWYKMKEYAKAKKRYKKSLELAEKSGDKRMLAKVYGNLATVQEDLGKIDQALPYYKKCLRYQKKAKDKKGMAIFHLSIGSLYLDSLRELEEGKRKRSPVFDSVTFHTRRAKEIAFEAGVKGEQASVLNQMGRVALMLGKPRQAIENCKKALRIAQEHSLGEEVLEARRSLAKAHARSGSYQKAYAYRTDAASLRDSLFNKEKSRKIGRLEAKHKYEKQVLKQKKERQRDKALAEKREAEQRFAIVLISSVSGLLLVFAVFLVYRFRVTRKQKGIIEAKKVEVDRAYGQLQEKNREIRDSITYASKIQSAILTSPEELKQVLAEHFILFRPKEEVSGDFYWAYGNDEVSIWMVADCTGHGVPGAFMSMIGNRLLNEVIVEEKERDPGKVLDRIRDGIIGALQQSGEKESKDGMDGVLCIYDRKKEVLSFAAGNNPLYLVRNASELPTVEGASENELKPFQGSGRGGERLLEIAGDKQPVGNSEKEGTPFKTRSFECRKGDRIYTFSDGFADQFGGPKGKKYRYKPFKRLILSLDCSSMEDEKEKLEAEFDAWKGEQEQIDDVLLIGVRI